MLETDNLIRGISENGGVVFYGIDSTAIVREMERLHKTSAVTTAALGRLLTGAAMMGAMLKSRSDSLTLQINGGGPAGRLLAVADGDGHVKGYVQNPVVELPPRADGHLDVGAAVGKDGTLDVIRDLGLREPYIGQVPRAKLPRISPTTLQSVSRRRRFARSACWSTPISACSARVGSFCSCCPAPPKRRLPTWKKILPRCPRSLRCWPRAKPPMI